MTPAGRLEYLGDACVDSGALAILDPCAVDRPNVSAAADRLTSDGPRRLSESVPAGKCREYGLVVTGWRVDGVFPVYARVDAAGAVAQVIIDFAGEFGEPRPASRALLADAEADVRSWIRAAIEGGAR